MPITLRHFLVLFFLLSEIVMLNAFKNQRLLHNPLKASVFGARHKRRLATRLPEPIFSSPIRVRFAPSPTGYLHVGGARTALYNWLFARKNNGTFVVRVEDTDQARSTIESEESILRDLKWMGMDWDEGPGIGGPYGPYRQSERKKIYQDYAQKLLDSGHAYHCFTTEEERLDHKEAAANSNGEIPVYNNKWRDADKDEVAKRLARGDPHTIRFRVPDKTVFLDDFIRGRVRWDASRVLGDFVILRSNGMPVYNFCVAVDDVLMKISHVIRGDEHLSNTLRQLLVMEALGARPPVYSHCSLILAPDKSKLSKRHGAASVDDFRKHGFLPQAMRNYLALLGWSSVNNTEVYLKMNDLVDDFLMSGLSKAPCVFDRQKLSWFHRTHMKKQGFENITRSVLECAGNATPSVFREFNSLSAEEVEQLKTWCAPLNTDSRMSPQEMFEECKKKFASTLTSICIQNETKQNPFMVTNETLWHACEEAAAYKLEETVKTEQEAKVLVKQEYESDFDSVALKFCELYNAKQFPSLMHSLAEEKEASIPPNANTTLFAKKWQQFCKTKVFPEIDCVPGSNLQHRARLALTGSMFGPDVGNIIHFIQLGKIVLSPSVKIVSLGERIGRLSKWIAARKT